MKYLSSNTQQFPIIFEQTFTLTSPDGEEYEIPRVVTDKDVQALTGKFYHQLTEDQQLEVYIHFCVNG